MTCASPTELHFKSSVTKIRDIKGGRSKGKIRRTVMTLRDIFTKKKKSTPNLEETERRCEEEARMK